jgi:hypothetical protein
MKKERYKMNPAIKTEAKKEKYKMNPFTLLTQAAMFLVAALSLIQAAKGETYTWGSGITGAWENGANWGEITPPTPGANIDISSGGQAQYIASSYDYYISQYGEAPTFDTVQVANNSALYLDAMFHANTLNVQNNGTLTLAQNFSLDTSSLRVNVTGNSVINADAKAFAGFDWDHQGIFNGDGTGTLNITGIGVGGSGMDAGNISNVNIRFEVTGAVGFDVIAGTGDLTMVSGTLTILGDQRSGGNTTIAAGATLRFTDMGGSIGNGEHYGGEGTVEIGPAALLYVSSGGRLDSSLTIFSSGMEGFSISGGGILVFMEDTPLTISSVGSFDVILSSVIVDFSDVSLSVGSDYVIIDWSGVTLLSEFSNIDVTSFSIAGTDLTGDFSVEGSQVVFHATAVPEPSVYFLMSLGLGVLLVCRFRRRVQS